jgi:hypothetical protein
LSCENPTNDLLAKKNQFPVGARAQMRQALRQVALSDRPGGAAEQRRNLGDVQGSPSSWSLPSDAKFSIGRFIAIRFSGVV